jgi:hypothetical protein
VAVAASVALGTGLVACNGNAASGGASGQPPGSRPGATTAPLASPTTAAPAAGPIVVDPGLLRILPASVAGIGVQASPESSATMIADPSLAKSASAIAVGVVVAAGDSGSDDLAVSSVIQLRPGVFSDDFYQGWRAAYDAAACAPAGGVSSHIEQFNGQHKVEVTVCAQGARTYHTHLAGDILVSITAVGDRKFGDLVMNGLRG